MDTLNFLKFQPLENWLDYLLERKKFLDLLLDDSGTVYVFSHSLWIKF